MSAFEHIILLLSFVYALALTHLLSCATQLIAAGSRVRFSWIHTDWMLNALAVIPFVLIAALDMIFLVRWVQIASLAVIGLLWVLLFCRSAAGTALTPIH